MAKKKKHDDLEIEIGELNLVPYMDIMVNLIMFMLLSTSSLIEMKIINVSVPAISSDPSPGTKKDDKPQLAVVLGIIDKRGFIVSVDGSFLEGTAEGQPTVPVLSDGKFDYATLTKKMEIVKAKQPELTTLTIIPDRAVDYNTLVKTMDSIRLDTGGKLMFPDVLLGVQ